MLLATICHMATVGTAQIEFCQEQVIARNESSDVNSCYVAAQQMIAPQSILINPTTQDKPR